MGRTLLIQCIYHPYWRYLKSSHVKIKCNKDYPALEKIRGICDVNHLNVKTLDISNMDDKYIELKAFFPYRTNPFLLDYFMNEVKKEEDVIEVEKVMKKPIKRFEDTHES